MVASLAAWLMRCHGHFIIFHRLAVVRGEKVRAKRRVTAADN